MTCMERSTQLIQFVQEREKCEVLMISEKNCQKQNSGFSRGETEYELPIAASNVDTLALLRR